MIVQDLINLLSGFESKDIVIEDLNCGTRYI